MQLGPVGGLLTGGLTGGLVGVGGGMYVGLVGVGRCAGGCVNVGLTEKQVNVYITINITNNVMILFFE